MCVCVCVVIRVDWLVCLLDLDVHAGLMQALTQPVTASYFLYPLGSVPEQSSKFHNHMDCENRALLEELCASFLTFFESA